MLDITTKTVGGNILAKAAGHLNTETAKTFMSKLEKLFDETCDSLILDFSTLDYISSAGIQAIYQLLDLAAKNDMIMVICSPKNNVMKVLKMVDIQADIEIYPTQELAIKMIAEKCKDHKHAEE